MTKINYRNVSESKKFRRKTQAKLAKEPIFPPFSQKTAASIEKLIFIVKLSVPAKLIRLQ